MNKPVINLKRYEVDSLLVSRNLTNDDHESETFNLDAKVGHTDDYTHKEIKLTVA